MTCYKLRTKRMAEPSKCVLLQMIFWSRVIVTDRFPKLSESNLNMKRLCDRMIKQLLKSAFAECRVSSLTNPNILLNLDR